MTVDYLLTGNEDMRNGALSQIDYALGLNALDLSFVTGIGTRSVQNPHHRPSGADGIKAPVPGFVVGGPNNKWTYPETKERLKNTPAAKYYIDETQFADMNEVAIYWNSPMIFVTAFFNTI
jgi:endoglucanase